VPGLKVYYEMCGEKLVARFMNYTFVNSTESFFVQHRCKKPHRGTMVVRIAHGATRVEIDFFTHPHFSLWHYDYMS
jgi:hypothetical protein